jgi:hypothetical protein
MICNKLIFEGDISLKTHPISTHHPTQICQNKKSTLRKLPQKTLRKLRRKPKPRRPKIRKPLVMQKKMIDLQHVKPKELRSLTILSKIQMTLAQTSLAILQ